MERRLAESRVRDAEHAHLQEELRRTNEEMADKHRALQEAMATPRALLVSESEHDDDEDESNHSHSMSLSLVYIIFTSFSLVYMN